MNKLAKMELTLHQIWNRLKKIEIFSTFLLWCVGWRYYCIPYRKAEQENMLLIFVCSYKFESAGADKNLQESYEIVTFNLRFSTFLYRLNSFGPSIHWRISIYWHLKHFMTVQFKFMHSESHTMSTETVLLWKCFMTRK